MADPVRAAAVRAVLLASVTLIIAMIAGLATMGRSWLAAPALLAALVAVVVSTWAVVDVWITRQVWTQRNGVVSVPSSAARAHRADRRRAEHAGEAGDAGLAAREEAADERTGADAEPLPEQRAEETSGQVPGRRERQGARRPGGGHGRHGGFTGTSRAA
jgi:hypothetical protein